MKKSSEYKHPFVIISLVALFFALLSVCLLTLAIYQPNRVDGSRERGTAMKVTTSSAASDWPFLETPVGAGTCVFIDQSPFVQTQDMVKKEEAKARGYAVELDPSMATGTLVSVCNIAGKDIQLIKESPYSEPESNWTLAIKNRNATSSWRLVPFRDTLQSDFPGCEIRRLYPQDDGRFVTILCSHRMLLGDIGRWEDYFLADTEKGTVKKYVSCKANNLNLVFHTPSMRDRFPLEERIENMRCSAVSDSLVRSR